MTLSVASEQDSELDHHYMRRALELARGAERAGEVPVGAVLIQAGEVIGDGMMLHIHKRAALRCSCR